MDDSEAVANRDAAGGASAASPGGGAEDDIYDAAISGSDSDDADDLVRKRRGVAPVAAAAAGADDDDLFVEEGGGGAPVQKSRLRKGANHAASLKQFKKGVKCKSNRDDKIRNFAKLLKKRDAKKNGRVGAEASSPAGALRADGSAPGEQEEPKKSRPEGKSYEESDAGEFNYSDSDEVSDAADSDEGASGESSVSEVELSASDWSEVDEASGRHGTKGGARASLVKDKGNKGAVVIKKVPRKRSALSEEEEGGGKDDSGASAAAARPPDDAEEDEEAESLGAAVQATTVATSSSNLAAAAKYQGKFSNAPRSTIDQKLLK